MKKCIVMLVAMLAAGSALAQFAGLPIAGGAAAESSGSFKLLGGAVLGDDVNVYGGRATFALVDGLTFFGDAGALDPDFGDTGWAIQGGGLFTLPMPDLPLDLGLRGSIGFGGYDTDGGDVTLTDYMGGLLVSKTIGQLTPYVFLGLNYLDATVDLPGGREHSEDETDGVFAAGLSVALNEQFSLYGEFAHIDDPFFGFGGAVRF